MVAEKVYAPVYRTRAEERLADAIRSIQGIVVDRCDGAGEFDGTGMDTLRKVYHDLLKVRDDHASHYDYE